MSAPCVVCSGACADADLTPLLAPTLAWLWHQVAAAADRRGDPDLTAGNLRITAPDAAAERAAAVGLVGGPPLRAGQQRTVSLAALTTRVRVRGGKLTPGAVAAHACGRPLAVKALDQARRARLAGTLHGRLETSAAHLPPHVRSQLVPWDVLQQNGTVARLLKTDNPVEQLDDACAALAALPEPGRRVDRRTLVPGAPHALDDGTPLAGLVLALTGGSGRRPRHAWDALGVDIDNLTGGLLALGIHPHGWALPATAVITLPPRELADVRWAQPPAPRAWVFVTENPSVLAAAADLVTATGAPVRLLCTVGTPSAVENTSLGRLADAGWNLAVRADFDVWGLAHVRAQLAAAPTALPWRMGADDYLASAARTPPGAQLVVPESATPWDPRLARAMSDRGVAAFEEDLLPQLLHDLRRGRPPG